jgi:hypothetical protein
LPATATFEHDFNRVCGLTILALTGRETAISPVKTPILIVPSMRYRNVCIEAFGYTLPDEIVTSQQIEAQLAPLYGRLRLAEGRLELMTGIRERRFWPRDMLPSTASVASAQQAMETAGIEARQIGAGACPVCRII